MKIEDGQCHGEFTLDQLTFYSGFYEIRAYTKYMLNFGEDVVFSRVFPVFEKPHKEGDYGQPQIKKHTRNYANKRGAPPRGKDINVAFYPEGGNLVSGVESGVAFQATDKYGMPIEVSGIIINERKEEVARFSPVHNGRGVFFFTPASGKHKAIVSYGDKKQEVDMPLSLPEGFVMEVDNLSYPDSIGITLRKSVNTPVEMFGVAVLNGGRLQNNFYVQIEDSEKVSHNIDKTQLPSGVSQIVLFNSNGEILCDRLIFISNNEDILDINAKSGKRFYMPYELVEMEFSVTDKNFNPASTTFSLSVRDGENMVEGNNNILTDLLLMSEIKGYVRNPAYYFEDDNDETRHKALDLLLMVQGWRRYSWKQMVGTEPFDLKYLPEQGIETTGQVVTFNLFNKQIPNANIDVGLFLHQKGGEDENDFIFAETLETDSNGRFSFVSDAEGKWNMILSTGEKAKRADRILLDRLFSPQPKRYNYADLQVNITKEYTDDVITDEETPEDIEDDYATLFAAYQDSLAKQHIRQLPEVTVRNRRQTKTSYSRSSSLYYYDVASEYDDIYDSGTYMPDNFVDIHEFLKDINPNFDIQYGGYTRAGRTDYYLNGEYIVNNSLAFSTSYDVLFLYGKMALFVVNYQLVDLANEFSQFGYQRFGISNVKEIYINENKDVIAQYILPPVWGTSRLRLAEELYSCVVFIETYPEGEIPAQGAKGVRKTWLEGYSPVKEFYSPNYSERLTIIPDDYRRTLYWNPAVTTDENGKANITFYNNSSSKDFSISAETVTPLGMIGVYKEKEEY